MPVWLEWQTRWPQKLLSERACGFDSHHRYFCNTYKGDTQVEDKKQSWEMTYDELYEAWASRYNFGAKGELTPQEAREIHNKWKNLGIQARNGLI
jgi:hypothetical protein